MPTFNPGELSHRVAVQEEVPIPDGEGNPDSTDLGTPKTRWKTIDVVWCHYAERGRLMTGSEMWQGQQVSPDVTGKITMRYWQHPLTGARLLPTHRLVGQAGTALADRIFNIEVVTNPGERGGTTLMAACVSEQQ